MKCYRMADLPADELFSNEVRRMILIELSSVEKRKYQNKFDEVKQIVDKLSKKELNYICNGTFKDSPYVVYRDIYYVGAEPAGFIDVYSFDKDDANIVLAVLKKYRNRGIARSLVIDMEQKINVKSIKNLTWKTDLDNIASQNLAKSLGYKLSETTKTSKIYRKPNPSYKGLKFI